LSLRNWLQFVYVWRTAASALQSSAAAAPAPRHGRAGLAS
jgi:hypothetical protein